MDCQLEQVVDARTCDVCRACFISIDPDTYYAPNATFVDMNAYLDVSDTTSLMDMKSIFSKEEKVQSGALKKESLEDTNPDADALARIKEILHPGGKKPMKEKMPVYVPERLNEMMVDLKTYVEKTGVSLYEIINIQYGKKLRIRVGIREAEINLFYGKRGFSVVQSPRCGTSSEFNQLAADLVEAFLHETT